MPARTAPTDETALGATPRQARGIEKRRRVFDAAMRAYARHGVEAARTEEIVADAGVGWGTFFNYFPRKQDVLLAAAVDMQLDMEDAIERAIDGGASAASAVAEAYRALASTPYPAHLFAAVVREVMSNGQRFEAMANRAGKRPLWVRLAELVEQAQRDGQARTDVDAATLARLLNLSMLAAMSRVGVGGDVGLPHDVDLVALADTSLRVLWDGIGARG